ncbi:hypothetical protein V6N13_018526 [Hibiscus sabdariffa]
MPGVLSCNAILDAVIRCKKPVRFAEEVFEEMIRNGISPNVFTYNILIRGFLLGGEFGEDRMKETNEVLQEMSWEGFIPDEVTYDTLVNGHCKDGNLHQALVSHAEMVWNGLLQTSLRRSPSKRNNLYYFDKWVPPTKLFGCCDLEKGVKPDAVTYSFRVCVSTVDLLKHVIFSRRCRVQGFLPYVTYCVLINGLNKQARTREADRVMSRMGFCMKGLMNEADRVFETMLQRNRNPDEAAYNVIIHGHRRGGNIQKAYDLYKW